MTSQIYSVPRWLLQSGVDSIEAWCGPYQQWAILKADFIWLGCLNCSSQGELAWALLYVILCICYALLFKAFHSSALTDGAGLLLLHQSMQQSREKSTPLLGMRSHHSDLHILRSDAAYCMFVYVQWHNMKNMFFCHICFSFKPSFSNDTPAEKNAITLLLQISCCEFW